MRLIKKKQKKDNIKIKLQKANNHWNDWKFQLHWNKFEWVDSNDRDHKNNPFCNFIFKDYIKDGNESFRFFGH